MEVPGQGTCDEVLALKQFLQEMLLVDHDGGTEFSLPAPGKGVIRNDKLLELMGVSTSEISSSDGCSAYSLDDERPAPVAPLQILSPQLSEPQTTYIPDYDYHLDPEDMVNFDRVDTEELLDDSQYFAQGDSPRHEGTFFHTHMNKTSARLLRRSATFEPDFQKRMKQFLLKNQEKRDKIRQSVVTEKEPDITPMPRINGRSKCISRNVSHLMAWNHEKESKLARMRDAETAKQDATCVGKPSISKRSVSIFSKRQDDIALCKVEDRLHLLGLIYQYQQEERKRAEVRQASSSVQPRLAPHSANAQRRKRFSVHERLYQLSKRKMAEKDIKDREHCLGKTAAQRRRERDAHAECITATAQRLHNLDKQYKQKQLLLNQEQIKYFDNLRMGSKMSARSRKLAAKKKKKHLPLRSPLRCGCCGGREDKEGKCGCTIEPRVNQEHATDIYERQLKWKKANEARHSQQKQLQESLKMTECTFRNPFYQKVWNTFDDQANKSVEEGGKDANAAFFKRCILWAEKRDRQVARRKKAFQERQLQECTFKPRVTRTPTYLTAKHNQSNRQNDATPFSSQLSSTAHFLDCSTTSSPEQRDLSSDELLTQLYSALDLQASAGELSPEYNSIGSDDEGAHGFPKYTFTDFGEFAGR